MTKTFSQGAAYVEGQIVPIDEAKISLLDWGFLHSDATYDVVHVWHGKFFRLQSHLQRFFSGMEKLRLSIPHNSEQVAAILADCVRITGLQDAYVEMLCTRGRPPSGSRDPRDCVNQFFAFAVPFIWLSPPDKEGLHLVISDTQRISRYAVDPRIKNYHWLDMTAALFQCYDKGGETAVLVDDKGNLVEGPGFNVFVVKDDNILSPEDGALVGITRKTVMELATAFGYSVIEKPLSPDDAHNADEMFITSTAGGVMPITKIDNITLSAPGTITKKLQDAYWRLHDNPQYTTAV
ncbi:MAG: aminotransferase class IV [Candidatus Zeuxoniibacter abyssi]|nr:MAG: aminotransferase class IV [Candidatus Persebacteraceae bacterium AB1(2)]